MADLHDDAGGRLPLSPAQQRLWLAHQLAPDSVAYNSSFAYRLAGPLRVDALRAALRLVVDRHEALRTRFHPVDDVPYQVVGASDTVDLEVRDLAGADRPDELAGQLVGALADEPFDLATGPLVRVALYQLGADEHLLGFVVHHIVFDGWSHGVFVRELAAAYTAIAGGQRPDLAPLPIRYADYVREQLEWRSSRAATDDLAYWRDRLAGAPDVLAMPTDRPRPRRPVPRPAAVRFSVPAPVCADLRTLARRRGATLFVVALAGYAALLGRYTGSRDVVIGVPAVGRNRVELEGLIGFFVNSLPMRVDLTGDPPFGDLVRQVRDTVIGGLAHAALPFERMVEEFAPSREAGRNPIFQAWFDMFPADPVPRFDDLAVHPQHAGTQATPFDLGLHLTDRGEELAGTLLYAGELFDQPRMRRFAEHYVTFLGAVATAPDRPVHRAPILSAAERAELLAAGRGPVRPPVRRGLAEWWRDRVEATPDAMALRHGARTWSYAELDGRARRVATALRERGVGPDAVVGLYLPRGVDLLAGLLGIIQAGGGYLPIDPALPAERVRFMLADSRARLVLTDPELGHGLPAGTARLLTGDLGTEPALADPATTDAAATDAALTDQAPVGAGPDHLLYLIYTSGSTGVPKGVAMPQRPILDLLDWQRGRSQVVGPTAQFSSISFDASVLELFATWLDGGLVVLIDELDRRDPERLLAALAAGGVRRLFCPPLVLAQLARAAAERDPLPPLAEFVPAGEALVLRPEIKDMLRRLDLAAVDNEYGPSETHVVTAYRLTGSPDTWPERPSIGRPVNNTEVYLLDPAGEPVPIGLPGEVYLAGPLAWGYLHRPALTAERFVPHPFADRPGQRLYRTGDLAAWREDGELEFLGRLDDQLKIRGFRVEPGEVEATLRAHPGVAAAAVVGVAVDGDRRLAGYVVPAAGGCEPVELHRYLRGRLPDHLVPSYLVVVPELPLTKVGKLDRAALPDPVHAVAARPATQPPDTPAERLVAGIWADVLGLPAIGAEQNFFEVGGHSLLAAQAVARLRRRLGTDLPLGLLFAQPTVAGFAAALAELGVEVDRGPAAAGVGGIPRRPGDGPAALSPQQRGLWLAHQLDPTASAYHLPMAYRVTGPLDLDVLCRALGQVANRQDALRTRFGTTADGEPYQLVEPPGPFPLDIVELPGADPEPVARELLRAVVRTPFELTAEPPVRAMVARLGPDDHVLLLVVHHLIFDGWSSDLLVGELTDGYAVLLAGGQPVPPELPVRHLDVAAWQSEQLSAARLDAELEYWRRQLRDAPAELRLPSDRPWPAAPTGRGARAGFTLPAELSARLRELAAARGVTLFTVGLAGFATLLCGLGGEPETVIGVPVAGRSRTELEHLIGLFVNTLPIRVRLAGDPGFDELVQQVRGTVADALSHPDVPVEQLVAELAGTRNPRRHPLFQVMFTLDTAAGEPLALAGTRTEPYDLGMSSSRFDLELDLSSDGETISGRLRYPPEVLDAATIDRLVTRYVRLLAAVADDPGAKVSQLMS